MMAVACLLSLCLPSVEHRESRAQTENLGVVTAKGTVSGKPHGFLQGAFWLKNNNLVFGLSKPVLRGN